MAFFVHCSRHAPCFCLCVNKYHSRAVLDSPYAGCTLFLSFLFFFIISIIIGGSKKKVCRANMNANTTTENPQKSVTATKEINGTVSRSKRS